MVVKYDVFAGTQTDLAVDLPYLYLISEGSGVRIVDISTPSSPEEIVFYETPGITLSATILGSYLYLANKGIRILDITHLTQPEEVGSYSFYHSNAEAHKILVAYPYAYVATWSEGLYTMDISDPFNPEKIKGIYTHSSACDLAILNDLIYVAGNWIGIVNISDPYNPEEIGYYESPSWIWGISISGDYLCAAASESLYVLSIDTPSQPHRLGAYGFKGSRALGIEARFPYLYVTSTWGLHIIEISKPSRPKEIAFYDLPGAPRGIAVQGSYAYVAAGNAGTRMIDISDPYHPKEVGYYYTPDEAWDVTVSGPYIYVSTYRLGLQIYKNLLYGVVEKSTESALQYNLSLYPNLIRDHIISIGFTLERDEKISLSIYDVVGRKIKPIFNGYKEKGTHRFSLSSHLLSPGMYFLRLESSNKNPSKRFVICQ